MTPDELDRAFTKVRDELKMTSREARQKAEDEIRAYVEQLECMLMVMKLAVEKEET